MTTTGTRDAPRSFALLGASGMVGSRLVQLLASDPRYARGTLLVRRAGSVSAAALGARVREAVVDFDLPGALREFLAVDDVFCCLGTTIKKAGSQAAFRRVDCDIPVAAGEAARAAGVRQYLIVTAVGADPASRVFYNRVKGDVEAALTALAFPDGVKAFHPSLITGDREESRPLERIAKALMGATRPLFAGGLARYRAIGADEVARAMHRASREASGPGLHVYEGERLFAMAREE